MSIFITGDTHGDFRRFKKEVFFEQVEMEGSVIPVPMAVIGLGVGAVMFALSCGLFRIGMRRYESAGS